MIESHYETPLVVASVLVAIFASYTALSLAGRVTQATGASARWWLAGGAAAMGVGIWAMHFVGMLSFRLPIRIGYDLGITFLSLVLPVSVSALALWQVSQPVLPPRRLLYGAVLMGAGINAMHYTGMAAMRMDPGIVYDPWLFAASVLIAVTASGAALWIAFRLRFNTPNVWAARAGAAVVMGAAIAGMHYTGMAAAGFPLGAVCRAAGTGFSQNGLAVTVIIATFAVLSMAMLASNYDARLDTRAQLLAASETTSAARQALLVREREARVQAEQINVMKDEFLAVISHELRTPLNAIVGWAQILRKGKAEEEVLHKAVETIERNALAQAKLIDDLLDMSKIISGKITLELQPVDPVAMVEQAVETARPAAAEKGIQLETSFEGPARAVRADARRLQQVLLNLLSNAVKFTPAGGSVRIALAQTGSATVIAVRDSGIGIAPPFLPHVFERFRQADATTTRHYGGLGLGLAIVKNLVELHGGAISAASEGEGRGAEFTVTLPADGAPPSTAPAPLAHAAPDRPAAAEVDLRGTTVLVVEDAADTLQLIAHLLAERGATVLTAADAFDALRRVRGDRPDVIVSDIGLPGMDGYDFIRRVRQLGPRQGGEAPALALTAFARQEDRRRALEAGFTAYMNKPFDQSRLLGEVARLRGAMPRNVN